MRGLLLVLLGASGLVQAADPPPPPRQTSKPPAQTVPQTADGADESLLEFLGADDVGDPAWWEFLKKSEPRANDAAPPPQDARR